MRSGMKKIACAYTDLIKKYTLQVIEKDSSAHTVVSGREHYMRGSPSEIEKNEHRARAAALELF
jgi:hypothetical protein